MLIILYAIIAEQEYHNYCSAQFLLKTYYKNVKQFSNVCENEKTLS